jgi:hypothetical protein
MRSISAAGSCSIFRESFASNQTNNARKIRNIYDEFMKRISDQAEFRFNNMMT